MIGKLNTTLVCRDGLYVLTLHSTEIVKWDDNHIELDTGGHVTATTARRMNQCAEEMDLGFRVYRKQGHMHVVHNGQDIEMLHRLLWIGR